MARHMETQTPLGAAEARVAVGWGGGLLGGPPLIGGRCWIDLLSAAWPRSSTSVLLRCLFHLHPWTPGKSKRYLRLVMGENGQSVGRT